MRKSFKSQFFVHLSTSVAAALCCQKAIFAKSSNNEMTSLIEEFRLNETNQRSEKIPFFREQFSYSQSQRDTLVRALALGVHYLKAKNLKTALQYLSIASYLVKKEDFLAPYIKYYLATLHHDLADYRQAAALSESILANNPTTGVKKNALELIIPTYFKLNMFGNVEKSFATFAKDYSLKKAGPNLIKTAAMSYALLGNHKDEVNLLEYLAEQHPLNEEATWAFNKLQKNNSTPNTAHPYYFSQNLLQRLASNRNLDSKLEAFLIGQADKTIRDSKNVARKLNPIEKVEFLISINLPTGAVKFEPDLIDAAKNGTTATQEQANFVLARLYYETRKYALASTTFNNFLAEYPTSSLRKRALEGMASSKFYMGSYGESSAIFEQLIKEFKDHRYGWDHFWTTYLSNDFAKSLTLLDTPKYVQLKDPNEPLAKNYWRGRILEKLGRQEEADAEFRYILQEGGASYYANLVLSRRPAFWAEFVSPASSPVETTQTESPSVTLTSMSDENIVRAPAVDRDTVLLKELVDAGLYREAMEKFENTKFNGRKNQSDLQTLETLANHLADFRAYRRIMIEGNGAFRGIPKGLRDLSDHQRTFSGQWKAVFPLAYDTFLSRVEGLYKIDKLLILSLMRTESRFDVYAKSVVGARGLMQLMPKTAIKISQLIENSAFRIPELYEPTVNIGYGGFYFKRLLDFYRNNLFLAIGAYNAGPIAMNRWVQACKTCETDELVESISFRESRRYVKEVIKYFGIYTKVYKNSQALWSIPKVPNQLDETIELF